MRHALIACLLALAPKLAWACASCGSGGKNPLILYPNERLKFYLGISQSSGSRNFDRSGDMSRSSGRDIGRSSLLAAALRVSRSTFLTSSVPYMSNIKGSRSQSSHGDPLFAVHWIAIQQSFAELSIPQWQFIASFKPSVSRGINENLDEQQLDVFGSGYNELSLSTDLWWGMSLWKFGISQSVTYSEAESFNGLKHKPGLKSQTIMTFGRDHSQYGKVISGFKWDAHQKTKVEGLDSQQGELRNLSAFLTVDSKLTSTSSVRLTFDKRGVGNVNQNGYRQDQWTIAFQQTVL